MAPASGLAVGDRVQVAISGGKSNVVGTVQFLGSTGFAAGEWVGVELDQSLGKNDGSVAGTRYFQCGPQRGLFIRPTDKINKVNETTKPAAKARPSVKRSVVGAAAGALPGAPGLTRTASGIGKASVAVNVRPSVAATDVREKQERSPTEAQHGPSGSTLKKSMSRTRSLKAHFGNTDEQQPAPGARPAPAAQPSPAVQVAPPAQPAPAGDGATAPEPRRPSSRESPFKPRLSSTPQTPRTRKSDASARPPSGERPTKPAVEKSGPTIGAGTPAVDAGASTPQSTQSAETTDGPSVLENPTLFQESQRVSLRLDGTVRFYGATQFAGGPWLGIELDDADGTGDGSVRGVTYFRCDTNRAVFLQAPRVNPGPAASNPRHLSEEGGAKRNRFRSSLSFAAQKGGSAVCKDSSLDGEIVIDTSAAPFTYCDGDGEPVDVEELLEEMAEFNKNKTECEKELEEVTSRTKEASLTLEKLQAELLETRAELAALKEKRRSLRGSFSEIQPEAASAEHQEPEEDNAVIREKARNILVMALHSGKLPTVLKFLTEDQKQTDTCKKDMSTIRQSALNTIMTAASNGELQRILNELLPEEEAVPEVAVEPPSDRASSVILRSPEEMPHVFFPGPSLQQFDMNPNALMPSIMVL